MFMETKLNNNEVKEIANMQKRIDSYEGFIKAIYIIAKFGTLVNYPIFDGTKYTQEMDYLWHFIKKHKEVESLMSK